MHDADRWWISRIGYPETLRAIARGAGWRSPSAHRFRREWEMLSMVELDAELTELAAELAYKEDLGTLDSIHLASAISLRSAELTVATWDRRLHAAALRRGMEMIPERL
jgi:predicted nucleic acid-binding protein